MTINRTQSWEEAPTTTLISRFQLMTQVKSFSIKRCFKTVLQSWKTLSSDQIKSTLVSQITAESASPDSSLWRTSLASQWLLIGPYSQSSTRQQGSLCQTHSKWLQNGKRLKATARSHSMLPSHRMSLTATSSRLLSASSTFSTAMLSRQRSCWRPCQHSDLDRVYEVRNHQVEAARHYSDP